MQEVAPGRYDGILVVQPGMQSQNAAVIGHLRLSNGEGTRQVANNSLTINGGYAAIPEPAPVAPGPFVNVTDPPPGAFVARDFIVSGSTRPNAQVRVTARVHRTAGGIVSLGVETVSGAAVADPNGLFNVPMHLSQNLLGELLGNRANAVDLKVTAIDPVTSAQREVEYDIATGE